MSLAMRTLGRSPSSYNPIPYGCVFFAPLWHPELSGSVFSSIDDYRHTCSVIGAIWTPQGRSFDGVDDQIDIGAGSTLDFTTSDFTLSGWFKFFATDAYYTLYDRSNQSSQGIMWFYNGGAGAGNYWDAFYTYNAGPALQYSYRNASSIVAGQWCLLSITRIGASVVLYKNGINDTQAAGTHIDPASYTGSGIIGRRTSANYPFKGTIGEVSIFNRALTPLEIQNNYQATQWRYL